MKNIYINDSVGKKILFDIDNNLQTMMEWEKPYMEAIIDKLSPFGDVLEIGFGLGYSANQIQKYDIKSHTIIESDPNVLDVLYKWSLKQKHEVKIVEGFWQKKLSSLGKFDSIFFDDAQSDIYPDTEKIRVYLFYYNILNNHANIGAKMSWYCDSSIYWITHPETEFSMEEFDILVPNNVEYISDKEKNKMYIPLIKFKNGSVSTFIKPYIDRNFRLGFF